MMFIPQQIIFSLQLDRKHCRKTQLIKTELWSTIPIDKPIIKLLNLRGSRKTVKTRRIQILL